MIKVKTLSLLIERDAMTVLPVIVAAHELEIQQAIFGEDNVHVQDGESEAIEVDPTAEAERLENKYGGGALEKAFGVNFKSGIARALKDVTVADGPASKKAAKEPLPA